MSRDRGASVLILALWSLFFLGALALAVGARVSGQVSLATALKADTAAYYAARAGVEAAILEVVRDDAAGRSDTNVWDTLEETWSRSEERFRSVRVGEGRFTVSHRERDDTGAAATAYGLEDEERRINLNLADTNLQAALFTRVGGLGPSAARRLLQDLQAYRQRKIPAGPGDDRLLTAPSRTGYSVSGIDLSGRLESVHELRLVPGGSADFFARVAPYLTLHGSGMVNVNTASREVLLCLAEAFAEEQPEQWAADVIAARPLDRRGVMDLLSRYRRIDNRAVTFQSTAFRATVTGSAAGEVAGRCRIDFVFDRSRVKKLYWRER